jgi:hypothetical protein
MSKDIPDSLAFIAIVILLALAASPLFASEKHRCHKDSPRCMQPPELIPGPEGPQGPKGDSITGDTGAPGRNGDNADGTSLGLAGAQVDMDWDYNGYQVGAGAAYYDDSEAAVVSVGRKVCWGGCNQEGLLKGSLGVSEGEVGVGVGFTWRP